LSTGLDQGFTMAAAELGMASASWLFAREVDGAEGPDGVARLRDALGRRWPVLDAICAAWLRGLRPPQVQAERVVERLQGFSRLVVVGLESLWLDVLLRQLEPRLRIGLLKHSELSPDWRRVQANLGARVVFLDLANFQSWAGSRSALLGFVYGVDPRPFATSGWVRVAGPDTRTQFRELIGWDVLGVPLSVYPRWMIAVPRDQFTALETGV